MTTYRYDRAARPWTQFLPRTKSLRPYRLVGTPEEQAAREIRWSEEARQRSANYAQRAQAGQPLMKTSAFGGPTGRPATLDRNGVPLPSIATTVWITLFFGIFGIIPASMHTNRAQMEGRPTNKYWKAFGWTMAIAMVSGILFLVIVTAAINASVPAYYRY